MMLPAFGSTITLIWMPTGIGVAVLFRWGFRFWPGLTLGGIAANLAIGTPLPVVLGIAVGNTLAPILAAWALRRVGFHPTFDRARDILLLAGAAVLGMLISSSLGVTALSLGGIVREGRLAAFLTWWGGDAMGVVLTAPLVFALASGERWLILRRAAEFVIWLGLTCAVTWGVFVLNHGSDGEPWALAFLPLPFLVWGTLRFGGAGTSLAVIVLAAIAAYGTATGRGPFFRVNPMEGVVVLWIYMATSATLGWVITAVEVARVQAAGTQRLFEQALTDVSLGVLLAGMDRRITYANAGFARLTGYTEAELLGKSCSLLHGPKTDPATVAKLKAAFQGGGYFDGEILNYRKDGTTFWNALLISPVQDERGAQTGFLGIQRDITERKRAEAAVRESEERLRAALSASGTGTFRWDIGTNELSWDNALHALFGLPPGQTVRSLERFIELVHPEDSAEAVHRCERCAREGADFAMEFRVVWPDGSVRWLDDRGKTFFDAAGRPMHMTGACVDITERKRAEEAVRESEERFRALIEHAPEAIQILDATSGRFLQVNSATERLFRRSAAELGVIGPMELSPPLQPDGRPSTEKGAEFIARTMAGEAPVFEWMHCDQEGREIPCEVRLLRMEIGGRAVVRGSVTDITERKAAEVREASHVVRLKHLSELSLMLSGDPGAVFERVVRLIAELFGVRVVCLSEIVGSELFFRSVSVDGEVVADAGGCPLEVTPCATVEHSKDIRVFDRVAERFPQASFLLDHKAYAYCGFPVLDTEGRVCAVTCLLDDKPHDFAEEDQHLLRIIGQRLAVEIERAKVITERKRAEDERTQLLRALQESQVRLQTLVTNLPGMAYRCLNDPNWTMSYVSEGCDAVTGYRRDELENNRVAAYADLIHPDDRDWLWAKCQKSLDARIPCQNEYRIIDRNGRERWVAERASGVYAVDGTLLAIDGFIQDITAAQQARIEREQLDRKIQETQKLESLGVLAGGIAHDFNNLLTAILGNASIAQLELPPGSSVQDCIQQITDASMRAADLCRQMLAYSGRGRFIVERHDLGELVEQTTQMLQLSISKKAVLRFHLEKGLPVVEVDATQIRQVVMNLVINASEAIGDKSGVISLATGLTRVDRQYLRGTLMDPDIPEGDYVFLEVSDSGCGMSPETVERIFDPFFTTKFTGRGLGLAAVLGIVRGHKGALKVYSEVGRGTTFKLLFPAVESSRDVRPAAAPIVGEWHRNGTVLIVDDEETMRTTLARMMRVLGLDPVLVRDGREAVEIFAKDPARFSFVLLDLTMPHMDGEQAFTELRRLLPEVRVVLMSGFNAQEALTRFSGKGLAGFLQKPFTIAALRSVLQTVLA